MAEYEEEDGLVLNEAQDGEYHERRALFESRVDLDSVNELAEEEDYDGLLAVYDDMQDLTSFYGPGWISKTLRGVIRSHAHSARIIKKERAEKEQERAEKEQERAEKEQERAEKEQERAEKEEARAQYARDNLLSIWTGWLQYDPVAHFTSMSTKTTQVPRFYRPDSVKQWSFASCEGLAYSREECVDFMGAMDDTIVNRVNSKDMSTYSMGSETGHGEPAVQSAFDKLIAAVVEALQQGDHDPGSELKANKAGTRDLLSGTTRNPDGTVFYGEDAVCLVELKTESSFNPDVLEKFNEQALISHAAKVKLFNSSTRKVHKTSIEMIGDPVAQICCYMVSRECRYGILSNWAFTFFLKLELDELGSMVLHCSDRFSPFTRAVREDEGVCAAGNEFLGTVVSEVDEETPAASLIQASTLFVWLAMRDRVVGREDDVDMKKALRARAEKTSGLEDHPIGSGSSFSLFKGRRRDNGNGNVERNGEGAKGGKMHGVVDGVALTFDYWHVSSVVSVLFEQGIGYKQTTVTDLETGEEISDCFAKCIAVDDADARDAYSHQCAMHHFENEVAMYEGPALGLQGTVVPTVVHVGEFDMGAGKQAVLVTRNAGHALSSREGKRIARAEGLVAVKKRVHAALGSLHEAGIIHGDMGLRNVTIREDGGVCLIDLGSAFCGGPSGAERDLELFDKDFDATFKAELASSSREKSPAKQSLPAHSAARAGSSNSKEKKRGRRKEGRKEGRKE